MNIGFVGLGKLGLPVALAIESKGHKIFGYDINPNIEKYIQNKQIPYVEKNLQPLLDKTNIELTNIDNIIINSDIIFLPIQTPHDNRFEGVTKLTEERKDFDYSYLINAIKDIAFRCEKLQKSVILAVISTCLPGTYQKLIEPELNKYIKYVYSPQFIAMGTVLDDYLNPEFALIGVADKEAAQILVKFYNSLFDKPHVVTDITTAEGIKVSYNTWITAKTVIANSWGELSYKLNMNFDDIFYAWSLSNKRLISTKYMQSGMSDGGGCHPRDNIAMSWLAKEVNLSHDIFEDLIKAREDYEKWHGQMAADIAKINNMPLYILGKAFKPETNIETGSAAILMSNLLDYPHEHIEEIAGDGVYFVATGHDKYKSGYTDNSIILDPFGFVEHKNTIKIGRK